MNDPYRTGFLVPAAALLLFGLGLFVYFSLWRSKRLYHALHAAFPRRTALIIHTVIQKLGMFVAFGVIPALVIKKLLHMNLGDFGLRFAVPDKGLHPLLPAGFALACWLNPGAGHDSWPYPQLRVKDWTLGLFVFNALLWAIFLLAYEFMFRGFLFFAFLRYGFWVSAVVNISLYSLSHAWKGVFETLGTIPLGLLFCYMTFRTGTMIPAFILHFIMAVVTNIASVRKKRNLFYFRR